jgi:hypothetical protein
MTDETTCLQVLSLPIYLYRPLLKVLQFLLDRLRLSFHPVVVDSPYISPVLLQQSQIALSAVIVSA